MNNNKKLKSKSYDFNPIPTYLWQKQGDDFILITTPDFYIRICESIVENFDKIISGFYDTDDRQWVYIISENRQGQDAYVSFESISIAFATND